jgi:hypothetical protein
MFRREDQLELPNKRRVVHLIERDDSDHAQPLTASTVDLLVRLDHHRIGRLARMSPSGE